MKVVAFLPVKGTSERIENKNIKLLDGKPLFLHTLEKLLGCSFIDEVYLDSESEEIFTIAEGLGHKEFHRDPGLARNTTDGNALFYNEVKNIEADIYIQILCTSPFIRPKTIYQGLEVLKDGSRHDSAVLMRRDKWYTWNEAGPEYDISRIPNSVDLPWRYTETMGLYIVRNDVAHGLRRRIGDSPFQLFASPLEAVDVNYPEDFDLASFIAAGMREKERQLFSNLKSRLSSSMLSDILDEFGVRGTITRLKLNIPGINMLGRAKTLRLKKLCEGNDPGGIYDALKSYETLVPGDIIMVENEAHEYAYFGELNANLAIRSGAIGAVIGGLTRDTREVERLNFPVFADGHCCADVKGRATLDSINKKIRIEGVEVSPGDLVFGDNDGVVVVPKKIENRVLEKAYEIISKEKRILLDIALGEPVGNIVDRYGNF